MSSLSPHLFGEIGGVRWTSCSARASSLIGIEVKSGRTRGAFEAQPGLAAFAASFRSARTLLVGGDGVPLEDFLARPAELWLQGSEG